MTDRWQKEPSQEHLHFFKKISLIHDYKNPTLLVIAWLPYGMAAQQKYSIYLVSALPLLKIFVFVISVLALVKFQFEKVKPHL